MVMFSTWQRTASDQKRTSVMQMTSEDTGLGALTPNLAGYLGKVQERTSSLENCPWCSSKGWVHALRSYRVNLQESITLCTNPQCLYPLVSRPLEDVLAELVPVKTQIGVKKNGQVLPSKDIAVPPPKRLRSNGDEQALEAADSFVTEEEPPAIEVDGMELNVLRDTCEKALRGRPPSEGPISSEAACQGEGAKDKSDDVLVPTWSPSKPTAGETALASASPLSSEGVCGAIGAASAVFAPRHASVVKDGTPGDVLFRQANGPLRDGLRPCSLDSNQGGEPFEDPVDSVLALAPANEPMAQKPWLLDSDGTSMLTGATTNEIKPEALSPTLEQADPKTSPVNVPPRLMEAGPPKEPEKLVSPPPRLFWRNSDNLCWLDTLLVALVNCKSLRDHGPSDRPQKSPIWELITKYDEVCAAVQAHQHTGKDGVARVPNGVLQNAYSDLHSIRMSVFRLLQPKLQCRLGRRETPVFALPVLVAGDPWAESLFEQTFEWEFECSSCKGVSNTRQVVTKPLPTFTGLVPDWHPEKAAHLAPCNMCHKKNQRRTMVLDSIPPVFALHFVNGLPSNDPQTYSFRRHGRCYAVSTVIQYDQTIKHFVTWTRTSDGMWQEFDDLKHPGCSSHAKLPVPAQEMHIVFWEADKDPARQACSPPTPVGESPPSDYKPDQTAPPALSPDQSLLQSYDDGDIDCALALSEDGSGAKEASADLDASIGSTTLLDTFEGLSHSDIVTLTLVEVRVDSEGNALADVDPAPETASPDTSNVIADSPPKDAPSEVLSDPDSAEHMSSDPTFVPGSSKRKRQVRVKAKSSSDDNKGRKPKAKTAPSRGAPSKRSKKEVLAPVVTTAVAVETPPGPTAQPAAAATGSSRNTSPPPSPSEKSPEPRLEPVQQARWSFMLSRHPQSQAKDTPDRFLSRETPAAPAAAAAALEKTPIKSAPIPARRASAVKPQLRKESGELPLKHAGMYDAFGVNRKSTSSSSPQPAPQCPSHKPPHTPLPAAPRTPGATKTVSNAFLSPGATALPDTALSGKRDGLPGVAGGPGATDALRCKLLKKLKAKKKKLEALNQLLSRQGGAGAEACSPQAVTSSTTVSACEDLFTDWLSPTSTVSNLSPDSSGLLEMRANGREAGDRLGPTGGASQMNYPPLYSMTAGDQDQDHLLEEFMSAVPAQQQTQMETQDLGELDAGGKRMCAVSTAFESFDMDDLYLF
ncbi:unnamed protein product [Lota lota]